MQIVPLLRPTTLMMQDQAALALDIVQLVHIHWTPTERASQRAQSTTTSITLLTWSSTNV